MGLRKAPRHALEHRFVIEAAEAAQEARLTHHARERLGLLGDGVAQTVQGRPRRHPDAGADERPTGRQVEIKARAPAFRFAPDAMIPVLVAKPPRGVRLVSRLVL